jgi:hypothetical protein
MTEGTGTTEQGDVIGTVTTRLLKDDERDFTHEIVRPGLSTMILAHYEDMNNLNPGSESQVRPHISSVELGSSMEEQHVSDTGTTDKVKQSVGVQKKRTRKTTEDTQTQPLLLVGDHLFVAVLRVIPTEDWYRTWAASRTIMLTRTSKGVKEEVQKMCLSVVVCLRERDDHIRNMDM